MHLARRHHDELTESPIDPAWVREGNPVARISQWATSRDGRTTTYVWSCTAGTFDWHFGSDEIVHVVEGSVTVTDAQGRTSTLNPGDSAFFAAGTTWLWHVPEYLRKHATLVAPVPAPAAAALRTASRAKALLRRSRGGESVTARLA